jgi:uncharacterized membrane protein
LCHGLPEWIAEGGGERETVRVSDILWAWGEAFLRWLHVIAGIAWIGSSFYFIHLDLSLKRREGLPAEAYGEAWQRCGAMPCRHPM